MKIHILSDLHLEHGGFENYTPPDDIDVVVLAGDIHVAHHGLLWAVTNFPQIPVVYVVGNHEFYRHPEYMEDGMPFETGVDALKELSMKSNIHFLENDVFIHDGVAFFGTALWTDYSLNGNQPLAMLDARRSMNDYRMIRMRGDSDERLAPEDALEVFKNAYDFLEDMLLAGGLGEASYDVKKKIVVTHHLPSEQSTDPRYKDAYPNLNHCYASNLDNFILYSEPDVWIHGHTHHSCDYHIGKTRVLCNPRGYHSHANKDFDPGLILEV